jgi:hypothetical protein
VTDPAFWARFVVAVLATWRITHLLSKEDGPAELLVRLRSRLGSGLLGQLLDCFYCLSLWVAAPLSALVGRGALEIAMIWLSLSGAACLLERLGPAPVVFQAISDEESKE